MSRTQSTEVKTALFSQYTNEAFLLKLKIDHADLTQPLYFVDDMVNHTDGALQEWVAFPFLIELPDDTSDQIPYAKLTIDNVDRQIIQTVRTLTSEPTISLWVCLGSDIDDHLAGPFEFSLTDVTWDVLTIAGSLEYEPILNLAWPQHDLTPLTVPGLFKE